MRHGFSRRPPAPLYTSCLCQPLVRAIAALHIWEGDEKNRGEGIDEARTLLRPAVRKPRPPDLPRRRRPPLGVRGGGAKVALEARRRGPGGARTRQGDLVAV